MGNVEKDHSRKTKVSQDVLANGFKPFLLARPERVSWKGDDLKYGDYTGKQYLSINPATNKITAGFNY